MCRSISSVGAFGGEGQSWVLVFFTALRSDVIDYLHVEKGMSLKRIRGGVHVLARCEL